MRRRSEFIWLIHECGLVLNYAEFGYLVNFPLHILHELGVIKDYTDIKYIGHISDFNYLLDYC